MDKNRPCPIWNPSAVPDSSFGESGSSWDSPRAGGKYFVDASAIGVVGQLKDRQKARLTTWLIKQRRLGTPCPVIPYDRQSAYKDHHEFKSIINGPDLTIHERADELLKYIQRRTSYIGKDYAFNVVGFGHPMKMLAYTESINEEEVWYLRRYLIEQEWLEITRSNRVESAVVITVNGYARLALIGQAVTDSTQAFVAMWFDKSLGFLYPEAIKPAIEDAGYDALIINEEHFLDKIDDQIIAGIKRSLFVVADFTHGEDGARGSVYYEAGFAQGLGKDVIFTCRKDIVDNNEIHFDIRQYPYVVWEQSKLEEFRKSLASRIERVIGDGPLKSVPG